MMETKELPNRFVRILRYPFYEWGPMFGWTRRAWFIDMMDWIKLILVIGGVIVTVFGGFIFIGNKLESIDCKNKANALGLEYDYRILGGCLVKINDSQYVPLDQIRFNEDGKVLQD